MELVLVYPISLAVISAVVASLERLFPWRKGQKQLRAWLWSDVVHLVFNAHYLGVILYGLATRWVLPSFDRALSSAGLMPLAYRNAAAGWPLWAQIVVALFVVDFVQWCVHNLLHRVPFLWEFHKVHHSVKDGEMDWIVSFRFQWAEVVVYKTILYLPLAFFGFSPLALLFHAVFGTIIGHLNHANLDLGHGAWRYIFNSPRMHLWHHFYEGDEKTTINFGIIFSIWDWVFGTGRMPADPPPKLGFEGVETFPNDFFGQAIWPLQRLLPASVRQGAVPAALGVATLAGLWVAHQPAAREMPPLVSGESLAASQPSTNAASASGYARSAAEAELALRRFGSEARAAGFARPEYAVSVSELAAALGSPSLVLLDLRPAQRVSEGRIPSAQPVSIHDFSDDRRIAGMLAAPDDLQSLLRARGVRRGSTVVLYGDGGPEAYRLFWALLTTGGLRTRVLDGGLIAWKSAGHPVAGGAPRAVTPGDVTLTPPASPPRSLWAHVGPLMQQGALLLDTRTREEYLGARQHEHAARSGHIPGAVSLPWKSVLRGADDPRLLPPARLRALFAPLGVARRPHIITQCQSGNRSAAVFYALIQTGVDPERLTNYDGSWAEYSRLDLPMRTGDQP